MSLCEYCGFGPHTKGTKRGHYWSCPNHPEMKAVFKRANKIAQQMIAGRKRAGSNAQKNLLGSSRRNGQLSLRFT